MYTKIGVLMYLLAFNLFFISKTHAQEIGTPFHQRIDLTNKMPSDVIYQLAQDKKGTMWLASEKGLFSYNGFYFTSYQIENSNNYTNDVIGVQIDYLNRPIALDFSRHLVLIDNGKVIYSKKDQVIPQLKNYDFRLLNFSDYSLLTDGISVYKIQGTTFTVVTTINPIVEANLQEFNKEGNKLHIAYSNGVEVQYDISSKKTTRNSKSTSSNLSTININGFKVSCNRDQIVVDSENGNTTFETPISSKSESKPTYYYTTQKANVVYGVVSPYLFILDCNYPTPQIKWYFISDASTLSSVMVSKDGTLHISTLGDGMYKIYPEWLYTQHITYNTNSKILYYAKVDDKEIAIQKRRIYLYKNGRLYKSISVKDDVLITKVIFLNGYYYASGFHYLFKIPKAEFENIGELNYLTLYQYKFTTIGCKDIANLNNNLYFTTSLNLVKYQPEENKRDTLINERCDKMFNVNNLLFVNTESHLEVFDKKGEHIYNLNIRASAITAKDSNYVFILNKTNDLFVLNLKTRTIKSIKSKLNRGIDDILWYRNYLYICNSTGINRLNYFAHNYTTSITGTYEFSHYDMELINQDGRCILSSNRGVIAANISDFFARKYLPTYLTIETSLGDKKDNTIYLNREFNHLNITVVDENLASFKFLVLIDGDSSFYNTNRIQLGVLKEGKSNVTLIGYDRFGNPTKPLNFTVSNTYPFFSSRIFTYSLVGTVICLLLMVVYSLYNYKLKLWEIEAHNRNKEMETRLVALRSQMNPHFIYNVLNTAQSHMFSNNLATANSIITKLSNIIREVLESTKTRYISIEEEIKLISDYCELEQERYDKKFKYEIIVDENLNRKLKIPYFFVQPLVENAIWHGLIKDVKNKDKKLIITFSLKDRKTVITVNDNGIGYDINKVREGSVALNNLRERMAIKKQSRKIDATLDIYNKKDLNINEKGTICELKILMPDFV